MLARYMRSSFVRLSVTSRSATKMAIPRITQHQWLLSMIYIHFSALKLY